MSTESMGIFWSKDPYAEEGLFKPEDVAKYYGDTFYFTGADFWRKQEKTNSGMLDGYTYTHDADIKFSQAVLERQIKGHNLGNQRCAEFGAGIGRVTKNLLIQNFKEIDLIDPVKEFLEVAQKDFGDSVILHLHPIGAQDWKAVDKYDCFWIQWTLMYLTDDDTVKLLKDCKSHLKRYGKIFVKENGFPNDDDKSLAYWNPDDHSFARSHESYLELFKKAGVTVIEDLIQPDWDEDLLPLYVFVLR